MNGVALLDKPAVATCQSVITFENCYNRHSAVLAPVQPPSGGYLYSGPCDKVWGMKSVAIRRANACDKPLETGEESV
jgi:hypothetical protein